MTRARKLLAVSALGLIAALAVTASAAAAFGFLTSVKPYAVPAGGEYDVKPLLSVADQVPETSDPSKRYQMIGLPDGLGIAKIHGKRTVLMNHEAGRSVLSEPTIGEPLNRGAFVSAFKLAKDGSVLSGERAYDTVFDEDTLVGPAADATNATSAFSRFCSAFLADRSVGFSEPILLTGEESGGSDTYGGKGGISAAVFDNEIHTLPKLGRFAKENQVVVPHTGRKTVIFVLEDGPSTPDSQLYMYVGTKVPGAASVLRRNGLDNGKLYAFVAGAGVAHEGDLPSGSTTGNWAEIPNADTLTDVQLETAADAAGAMGFIRIEDGAGNPLAPGQFHFVTTGANFPAGSPYNKLGRLYRVNFNPFNPTGTTKLSVVYNADTVLASGGDTAISPDNIDVNGRYLMIQEDGTSESRVEMTAKGREGSVWRYDLWNGYASERVAELDPPGRDGVMTTAGIWETSGIIETTGEYGYDSWIFDVQAHRPTTAPAPNTIEDGQLMLMTPNHGHSH
ncbi:MAG: DUF839 domain-containing protein [Actinobacteria bacterium]|nr:DUF839 domain-containing protein [Actinomycetota bacterium]